jgi:hypothetical protein
MIGEILAIRIEHIVRKLSSQLANVAHLASNSSREHPLRNQPCGFFAK